MILQTNFVEIEILRIVRVEYLMKYSYLSLAGIMMYVVLGLKVKWVIVMRRRQVQQNTFYVPAEPVYSSWKIFITNLIILTRFPSTTK